MRPIELQLPFQLGDFLLFPHKFTHEPVNIFGCDSDDFVRIFSCVFSGGIFSVFFGGGVGVVGPQLFGFLVVGTQTQWLFAGSAFVAEFVVFGRAFSL